MNIRIETIAFDKLYNVNCLIVGKCSSGKTTWAIHIAQVLVKNGGRLMVLCGTTSTKLEWSHTGAHVFLNSLEKLIAVIANQKNRSANRRKSNSFPKLILVLDDCYSNIDFLKTRTLADLVYNGNHYGITLIMTVKRITDLPSEIRSNMDHVGVVSVSPKDIVHIYQEYTSDINQKLATFLIQTLTVNYGLCWLEQDTQATRVYHRKKLAQLSTDTLMMAAASWYKDEYENMTNRHPDGTIVIHKEQLSFEQYISGLPHILSMMQYVNIIRRDKIRKWLHLPVDLQQLVLIYLLLA